MTLNDIYNNPDCDPTCMCSCCETETRHVKIYDKPIDSAMTMMAFECSECSTIRESYLKTSAIKGRKISFDKLKEEVENCVDCQEAKKLAEQLPPEIKEMGMSLYCAKHSSVIMDVWNSFDF